MANGQNSSDRPDETRIDRLCSKRKWHTNLNNKESPERASANRLVIGLIFLFVIVFFAASVLGIVLVYLLILSIKCIFQTTLDLNNIQWLLFGVIISTAFAFFIQSFPSHANRNETPIRILKDLYQNFMYFFVFILAIWLWVIVSALIIVIIISIF